MQFYRKESWDDLTDGAKNEAERLQIPRSVFKMEVIARPEDRSESPDFGPYRVTRSVQSLGIRWHTHHKLVSGDRSLGM